LDDRIGRQRTVRSWSRDELVDDIVLVETLSRMTPEWIQ